MTITDIIEEIEFKRKGSQTRRIEGEDARAIIIIDRSMKRTKRETNP